MSRGFGHQDYGGIFQAGGDYDVSHEEDVSKNSKHDFSMLPDTPSGPGALLCQCFAGLAVADFVRR